MKDKNLERENTEYLIRKYKEEAMSYRQRSREQDAKQRSEEAVLPSDYRMVAEESSNSSSEKEVAQADAEFPQEVKAAESGTEKSNSPDTEQPDTAVGQLQVHISAANDAVPIAFATVLILQKTEHTTDLIWSLQTDNGGNTERVTLSALPATFSEQPEPRTVIPYAVYQVIAVHPDYHTVVVNDVQIFAGQTALLPVSFVPLSEKEIHPSAPKEELHTEMHSLSEADYPEKKENESL